MTVHFKTELTPKILAEFIELTEEPNFDKIVDQALSLFYLSLRNVARGYKLALVPYTEAGEVDTTKALLMIKIQS